MAKYAVMWSDEKRPDTIHLAGCTHLRLSIDAPAIYEAATADDAAHEVCLDMDYYNMGAVVASDMVAIAPCAR
jgi:hypothetical protein